METTTTEAATPETTETTAADLPPLLDADLNFAEGYQDRIGEHAAGSTFKNLPDAFKSFNEAQRTTKEAMQNVANLKQQLAEQQAETKPEIPGDLETYKSQLKLPEAPEGVQLLPEVLDKAISFAMEKGYGPDALADFMAFDLERAGAELSSVNAAEEARVHAAKGVIESAVGVQNYDQTIGDAQHVVETLGLPIEEADLVATPNMVLSLSKLKDSLSEGTLRGASTVVSEVSTGGYLSQAEAILSDPSNPYFDAFADNSHPGHANALEEHARLITKSME